MKINAKIELQDDDLSHIANLIDGKFTKRKATRREVTHLIDTFLMRIAFIDVKQDRPASDESLADNVIHDINEGGWSFIGQ